ncbi:MAG TPA: hypothetical protein PKY73_19230 [Hyphomonas sp.]|nr:hypothetical protein [Hyphomonas sp.]
MTMILDSAHLVPETWTDGSAESCYVFNPAIVMIHGRFIMAYRVVTADGVRRVAISELDAVSLQPKTETIVPLSDLIQDGGQWCADPRFCTFGERLFIHYNDGWRIPNQIYLLELDPDRLIPRGPARPLVLEGPRLPVEKNWLLFQHDGELLAVYRIAPHTILHVELAGGDRVYCRRLVERDWNSAPYAKQYGEPRGGTPPVRIGGIYYSFFHSTYPADFLRRLMGRLRRYMPRNSMRYAAGFYGFAVTPSFQPVLFTPTPVLRPDRSLPRRRLPPLNPSVKDSVYPSGAVWTGEKWIVAYGARDELCCIGTLTHDSLLKASQWLAIDE